MKEIEFLVIGSGPGGTSAALKLVAAGRQVLMIEQGDFLPKEKENRDSREVYGETRYRTQERWRDQEGETFQPWMHFHVGGNAKLYGSAHFRFRKADFEELEYPDGLSPAWPLAYEDYASYYDEAEKLYRVHGERAADDSEPTDRAYPYPAIGDERDIALLREGLGAVGVSTFPLPLGVDPEGESEGWKTDLAHFDAYPDPSLSKADPEAVALESLRKGSFELQTRTKALRFLRDGRRVVGLEVEREGRKEILRAQNYICSAGAIQSARLFLQSEDDGHFANSSGQVGRNYMAHLCSTAVATFEETMTSDFAKTFGTNHWYQPDRGGCLAGSIQTQGKWDATQYELEEWTRDVEFGPEGLAKQGLEFFFMTEDLPKAENRVLLDGKDGLRLHRVLTNKSLHEKLVREFGEKLRGLPEGSLTLRRYRSRMMPLAWCTHQCGTLRFGDDPVNSVLDRNCRTHDLENLWVLDGSFFPSSSALNPTLTIVANALRVGAQLANQ
ncbi:GMC oxidoreductase [Roseibacillus persicicus]|uniref:GMC family oxidoreductase n=1 Tax=Roseibacillus persicicus TaxID=454148 RepID=A0A918TF85_9BACT|nr:GMC family oxidoreductase [Roseibacillus persicicus]GHC45755.1 GMC family oxidoreductase [Roseibacillus persicicus]